MDNVHCHVSCRGSLVNRRDVSSNATRCLGPDCAVYYAFLTAPRFVGSKSGAQILPATHVAKRGAIREADEKVNEQWVRCRQSIR